MSSIAIAFCADSLNHLPLIVPGISHGLPDGASIVLPGQTWIHSTDTCEASLLQKEA